jgi:hypothetical protein
MRRGQAIIAVVALFSIIALYSSLWLKEALFSVSETRKLFSSLQAKLLCQSGVVLAKEKLKNGQIPSNLSVSLPEGGKIFISFQPDKTRTEVGVQVVGELNGRRFSQRANFSFPEGIGDKAVSIFSFDPESRILLPPFPLPLGNGLVKASLVLTLEEGEKVFPTKPFTGVESGSVVGVGEEGDLVIGAVPNQRGIFTFDGWWQIPNLPGPFFINFPFAPIKLERVEDERGPFKRVRVLPRFPRQYFLEEEKAHFNFSEHESGRSVKISGWTKGFRCYGPFYANASILLSGNSIFALMESRGDKVQVTGEVSVLEGGSVRFILGKGIISSLDESKERGFLEEKVSPILPPKPSWSSWLEETDPSLGGEGIVLPPFSLLDLSKIGEGGKFFFEGDGFVKGEVEGGKGWVVVFCKGTLTALGNIIVGKGSYLALVAKEFVWIPKEPNSFLCGLIWATDGGFKVQIQEQIPEPVRLLVIGSVNVNLVSKLEDEGGNWGVEFFYSPMPFPSFLVQQIKGVE